MVKSRAAAFLSAALLWGTSSGRFPWQHTEADIDQHLAAFEDVAPGLAGAA